MSTVITPSEAVTELFGIKQITVSPELFATIQYTNGKEISARIPRKDYAGHNVFKIETAVNKWRK